MKIELDLEKCQGYVCCVVAAPEIFDVDDDSGLAILKQAEPDDGLHDKVDKAVRDCPTNAIRMAE